MRLALLAARNLFRNRRRTALSLAALIVGVGANIALRGFVTGQQRMIIDNFVEGQLGPVQVHRHGYLANLLSSPLTIDMEDSPALREKIAAVPGVTAVSGRIQFGAMLSTPDTPDKPGDAVFFLATAYDPAVDLKVCPKR